MLHSGNRPQEVVMTSWKDQLDRQMRGLELSDLRFQGEVLPPPTYPRECIGVLSEWGQRAYTLCVSKNIYRESLEKHFGEMERSNAQEHVLNDLRLHLAQTEADMEYLWGLFERELHETYIQLLRSEPDESYILGSGTRLSLCQGFVAWIENHLEEDGEEEPEEEDFFTTRTSPLSPSRLH